MFQEWLQGHTVGDAILPKAQYHPYPTADQRDQWESLPKDTLQALIQKGEDYLGYDWPALPATSFMAFVRKGERTVYETPHYARRDALYALVLAECAQGEGRFLDDIINGIWAICEESFWGISAHNGSRDVGELLPDVENPYVDLFAGETAGLLAHILYLLGNQLDRITPTVCRRVQVELERRIRLPFLTHEDFWWMGFGRNKVNNWNPWILSNMISVFLLTEEDGRRREKGLTKCLWCLDAFVHIYFDDGGCDEGTSYWNYAGGTLFDCLDQLYRASQGKISFFNQELVKQIGRFLYRSQIAGEYYINFADGGAKPPLARDMIYRYAARIQDPQLIALALSIPPTAEYFDIPQPLRRKLPELFEGQEAKNQAASPPYPQDMWLDGIQVMGARLQEGSVSGLYLAAKGGHNDESHNHNDIGSCIVYRDGIPALIDIGVETYTRYTFSDMRYTIWTMRSSYHNLPDINGTEQLPGEDKKARQVSYQAQQDQTRFSLELSGTYPEQAGLTHYTRNYLYQRQPENQIVITDQLDLRSSENQISWHFMTAVKPQAVLPGKYLLPLSDTCQVTLEYDPELLTRTQIEEFPISDQQLLPIWGQHLYRITLEGTFSKRSKAVFTIR